MSLSTEFEYYQVAIHFYPEVNSTLLFFVKRSNTKFWLIHRIDEKIHPYNELSKRYESQNYISNMSKINYFSYLAIT